MTLDLFRSAGPRIIVPDRVVYTPNLISDKQLTASLLADIRDTSPWKQEKLSVAGQSVPFPRLVSWHGDPGIPYHYSGIEHPPADWTPPLLLIRQMVSSYIGVEPNGVLLNYYRDGKDSIGRHADKETDLVPYSPIAGVSLGVTRTIRFRPMGGKVDSEIKLPLEDGSLLVMMNDCQKTWTHEIKKEPDVKGERISLTFRVVHK